MTRREEILAAWDRWRSQSNPRVIDPIELWQFTHEETENDPFTIEDVRMLLYDISQKYL